MLAIYGPGTPEIAAPQSAPSSPPTLVHPFHPLLRQKQQINLESRAEPNNLQFIVSSACLGSWGGRECSSGRHMVTVIILLQLKLWLSSHIHFAVEFHPSSLWFCTKNYVYELIELKWSLSQDRTLWVACVVVVVVALGQIPWKQDCRSCDFH